jgi:hypothetical protein
LKFLVKTFLGKENDMRKLIALLAMSFLVVLTVNSSNVFAESPNDKILKKLDKIQKTLDDQVLPKLDECCGKIGVPRTGQTTTYAPGDDGDLQKGVIWPEPRFVDHGDGTVTDKLTGLVWLKNANCFGPKTWADALTESNNLAHGSCGLTDDSSLGDWRLPNIREIQSLIDYGRYNPTFPESHPFVGMVAGRYWSSTTYNMYTPDAWRVGFYFGDVNHDGKSIDFYVWPVRGGN